MPFWDRRKALSESLAQFYSNPALTAAWFEQEFSVPPDPALGHVALPCFKLSKVLKKASQEISRDLTEKLKIPGIEIRAAGPYANFKWDPHSWYNEVVPRILHEKEKYGSDLLGQGKTVVLEYCSPNIAKKLAFQHIRSTLIGNTLANIYTFLGYQSERINFVGDWGSQFARLQAAVELWGDKSLLASTDTKAAINHLFELYVRFHKEAETDPELVEKAMRSLQLLEKQDKTSTELWRRIRTLSLEVMEKTLKRMNVVFNHVEGESTYIPDMARTLQEVKSRAQSRLSEGAWIVDVEGLTTPALVQKKDGTTLYLTRDIAAAIDRWKRFKFERMYYVVSEQQKLHFQMLFGVLAKMGETWASRCEHISFGTVLFGAEKMSTREGRVIFLEDLLDEAKSRALVECTAKNPALPNKDEVAEAVGVGAVVFGELSCSRMRDIEFSWENILSLEGDTGPYVQYATVRCASLLEKAKESGVEVSVKPVDASFSLSQEEENLILLLAKFRSVLHQVVRENEPYLLTNYLLDVAKAFNRFYYRFPVLQATDVDQKRVRVSLVAATRVVLANGLGLLGVACPKEM